MIRESCPRHTLSSLRPEYVAYHGCSDYLKGLLVHTLSERI